MSARTKAIWERLLAGPLGGRPVWRVIVTHYHPDHVGLAGWFQAEKGAELWTTRTSWLLARMLVLDVEETATEAAKAFWRAAGMAAEIYARARRAAAVQLRRHGGAAAGRLPPHRRGRDHP